ncbi:MAG: ATP-binding protein [Bacteroidota bacterium]
MKAIILAAAMMMMFTAINAQDHQLEKIWETDSVVAIPESVLATNGLLYVSLIDGAPWDADGKGGVAKLGGDGQLTNLTWITGLQAPKGLGIYGNRLYVADISEVVVIDIKKGKIEKKIAVDSATGLNDITIDTKGIVYVSDSKKAKIWKIENDKPTLYIDDVKGINGLKSIGNELFIGAGKSFVKAGQDKVIKKIAEVPQGIDGIEPVGNGDFLLTAWGGYIWYVHADGRVETLLDTFLQKRNTADLGYDQQKRILYVPTFNAKTVAAYRLK